MILKMENSMPTETPIIDMDIFDIEKANEQEKLTAATEVSLISDIVKNILYNNRTKYGAIWLHGISKEVVKLNWSTAFKIAYSDLMQCLTWDHDEVIANNGNRTIDKDKLRVALVNYVKLLFTVIIELTYIDHFNRNDEENRQAISTALLENRPEVDDIYKTIEHAVINDNIVQLTTIACRHSLSELLTDVIDGGDEAICDILINIDNTTASNLYGGILAAMVAIESKYDYTYIDILTDVKQNT